MLEDDIRQNQGAALSSISAEPVGCGCGSQYGGSAPATGSTRISNQSPRGSRTGVKHAGPSPSRGSDVPRFGDDVFPYERTQVAIPGRCCRIEGHFYHAASPRLIARRGILPRVQRKVSRDSRIISRSSGNTIATAP